MSGPPGGKGGKSIALMKQRLTGKTKLSWWLRRAFAIVFDYEQLNHRRLWSFQVASKRMHLSQLLLQRRHRLPSQLLLLSK